MYFSSKLSLLVFALKHPTPAIHTQSLGLDVNRLGHGEAINSAYWVLVPQSMLDTDSSRPWKGFNPAAPEFVPRTYPRLTTEDELINRPADGKARTRSDDLQIVDCGHAFKSVASTEAGEDALTHAQRRSAFFDSAVRPWLEKRGIAFSRSNSMLQN